MAEVPEHLLRRSRERREALGAAPSGGGGGEGGGADASPPASDDDGEKIPASLLTGQAATPAATGGAPAAAAAAAPAATAVAAPPLKGPEGHTQRLLTVVKAGSIQDVKAQPTDKVHVWPHLLVGEFVASLAMTAFLLIFSTFVNAPLLATANFNFTPNPSKAPWYFLGLQELLTMFHPMVAGVTIPGIGIFGLILAPFIDKNPTQKPEDRKFAISLFTVFLMFWAVLVIIGSFFRGPGFNFTLPWKDGLFFDL
ncbi:MAG: menaquinol-cytochrome c reductase cytochrome b subunit [Acidimicrobiia bacterium]|nr:menaquinol-cytochrome c reductase cytochrome b subunit [Acidimicrobiia bacterium]